MNALLSVRPPLILASQSPRRRALLEQMGVSFEVQVSPADETITEDRSPPETARTLAQRKARPIAERTPTALVLAADTIVIHEGTILGKPESAEEAAATLRRLSSQTHSVYTGFALAHAASDRTVTAGARTQVTFASLDPDEIDAYVATGSPMDKAGSYGIQDHTGPLLIERLNGDYYTVVGLPLRRLYTVLQREFADLLT